MTQTDTRSLVAPQSHEFDANYNYNDFGLRPWFGFAKEVDKGGGSVSTTTTFDGDTWEVTLSFHTGSLLPPDGGETPAGTPVEFDTIREFRITARADDGLGERKASFHVRPRWMGLQAETDSGRTEIPVPQELANTHTDAVNVRVQGSNVPFDRYGDLLRAVADALDVNARYFADRHRTSTVMDAARYVRVHKNQSGPIHARTGPITSLAHVLENDREGYRKLIQNDTDSHGRNLPGYYHTATLGPERVREVFPDHSLPVEVKHYYAREAFDKPDSDPLAHPKLEAAYQSSRWDDSLGASDVQLAQLNQELDEWLYAVLADALGEPHLRAGAHGTYVEDHYFDASNDTTHANVVKLNLTEVRHEQESVIYRHLASGMSPTQQDTLQKLVTDGGKVSPQDIADDTGRHQDTVYRALQDMNDLVEHVYGEVSLRSTYLSELVADALDEAETAVTRATHAAAEAAHTAERGLDERTSAFLAWQSKHVDDMADRDATDGGVTVDLGRVDNDRPMKEARRLLREGLELWEDMGRDPAAFRMGKAKWRYTDEGGRFQKDREKTAAGRIWQMIRGRRRYG